MRSLVSGKKTYLVAIAATLYAAAGYALGQLDANQAVQIFMEAGLGATIRAGIAKGR